MKVIGHRGAAGLAPENTLSAIQAALDWGVDGVEIDIRMTRDRQLVLSHDKDLSRLAHDSRSVKDLTYAELRRINLPGDEHLPLLEEVLSRLGDTPIIIEIKSSGCARPLVELLDKYPQVRASVASFRYKEIAIVKELRPRLHTYLAERTKPIEVIQYAKLVNAYGLDLNFWILNPLTYLLARRAKLNIMVYTVNNRFIAWWLNAFYPKILICTNYPNRLRPKRRHRKLLRKKGVSETTQN